MIKKKINKTVLEYFHFFEKKNIVELEKLFSQSIIVHDWNNLVKGKKKSVEFNKKIFNSFNKINIKILNIFYEKSNKIVSCQIQITLDKIKIKVVDILFFDKNYKITKVMAYKL